MTAPDDPSHTTDAASPPAADDAAASSTPTEVAAMRAEISSGYRWRLGLIALALLAFGLYCVYDATIAYPAQKDRYEAWLQTQAEYPDTYPQQWQQVAQANGWDRDKPKKRTDTDIVTQWVMAAIILPAGLLMAFHYIRAGGRWVAMDAHGLTANGGRSAPWASIRELDDLRWSKKGIAVVHYGSEAEGGTIRLDDWKFDREPTHAIHDRVHAYLHPPADDTTAVA